MDHPDGESTESPFLHPVEAELDTEEEQAHALLLDLRDSFAPSYLTLISIIEGVLLGLLFELVAEGRIVFRPGEPTTLLVLNDVLLIMLVWNEYRMGSCMFRWVPSLADAVIPFTVGGIQAALILSTHRPLAWLAWLAAFYLGGMVAYENMYRSSAAEERNAFVLARNRRFRRLNPRLSVALSAALWALFALHAVRESRPGWGSMALVTALNLAFLVRGELNWRIIVAEARRTGRRRVAR